MTSRRGFLQAIGTGIALLAAPPLVRASSIMPVKSWVDVPVFPPSLIVEDEDKRWHHVSVIRRGTKLHWYVDGYLVPDHRVQEITRDKCFTQAIIDCPPDIWRGDILTGYKAR